ncbi:related to WD repeat-containing 44 [Lecanosticta acicola]|uniref:Related to WD repeat-containing 44 n=1 Tax=Lecanosticta acicola TaxID=111012 RepID=A0AAI8Z0K0_9PEZI|nr:related to WD repeat-containing 44 [Lecanosticta acicola]
MDHNRGDVPAITLTDASPAQSPTKDYSSTFSDSIHSRVLPARPGTPGSRSGHARNDSSSAWPSPGRLIRTLSSHAQAASGTQKDDANTAKHDSPPAIDPLSQHILTRTNAPLNLPSRPRTSDSGNAIRDDKQDRSREHSPAPAVQEPLTRTDTIESTNNATAVHRDLKKGVKAVSFLSRLMGSAKRKDAEEEPVDDESATSEGRPEGNDAEVFAQRMDNMGYSPRHPQPPAYIKVRAKFKKEKDFDRLFLAQELQGSRPLAPLERTTSANKLRRKSSATPSGDQTVWAMEFSRDGKYLAAAGADMIVRVWAVLSSAEDRQKHESQETNDYDGLDARAEHLSAPVFQSKPVREYSGHTSTVLDLSWSKNNFLLSSSMDKTVRLWHVTRADCLCTFKHTDFVPSISFHPKDDRFFLAGSLDAKLRLWSIPDKSVAYAAQLPEMITAVAFTPDGKFAMAGCLNGLCMFYETEGLKYQTQIHVRSTRGQNAKGSKITGIQAQYGASGDVKVLITSNDSRIRLYNFRDKSLELKFRGNENNCSQIRAKLSDDGRYVVCGSEDRKAYLWSLHQTHGEKRDRTPVEMFEAHNTITTAVCIAPTKTRQHLSRSEDPVYDLCNPPPVTLLSRAERAESRASSRPPTENGSIRTTPLDAEGTFQRPREPASYLSRSSHKAGNIIVTADYSGKIKVFRQDCAWTKRQRDESDRSSLFGKRSRGVSRTGSLATKASQRSLRDASRTSASTQAPSDRILSWRQGINSTGSINERGSVSSKDTSRSISPRKSLEQRGRRDKPGSVRSAHPLAADSMVRSPSPTKRDTSNNQEATSRSDVDDEAQSHRTRPEVVNPLSQEGDRSYVFWDKKWWQEQADQRRKMRESHDHLALPAPPGDTSPGHSSTDEDHEHDHLAVRPPLRQIPTDVNNHNAPSDNQTTIPASGKVIDVDLTNNHATLQHRYLNPASPIFSTAQGSFQRLPTGHVFQGHGYIPILEEFSPEGHILSTIQFATAVPHIIGADGEGGGFVSPAIPPTFSYRAFKQPWIGCPTTRPSVSAERIGPPDAPRGTAVYISWNGATEVEAWELYGGIETVSYIDTVKRTGFETVARISSVEFVRVKPVLRRGAPADCGQGVVSELAFVD